MHAEFKIILYLIISPCHLRQWSPPLLHCPVTRHLPSEAKIKCVHLVTYQRKENVHLFFLVMYVFCFLLLHLFLKFYYFLTYPMFHLFTFNSPIINVCSESICLKLHLLWQYFQNSLGEKKQTVCNILKTNKERCYN